MNHKMIIVSDTSPISNLLVIDKLVLLQKVFSKVFIPDQVYMEILRLGDFNFDLKDFRKADWIIRKSIHDLATYQALIKSVDAGEAEAVTLANELHADYILIDEKKGRTIAHQYNIKTLGLPGVLLKAKQQRHVPQVKTILDQLRNEADFWITEELYLQTLKLAGERKI